MKNPKSTISLVFIYVAFLLVIGYHVYKGVDKLIVKIGEMTTHGNPKIPTP